MMEAEIWGIAETGDGYMVFVKPLKSELVVPVFIGQMEAQALLIGFGGITPARPLTADLLHRLVQEGGFKLLRAEINELKDSTFFALLVFEKPGGGELLVDSRPSDAMALAVRCKSALFVAEKVVAEAGIPADSLAGTSQTGAEGRKLLRAELDEAVAAENYERAAEIRDLLGSWGCLPGNS